MPAMATLQSDQDEVINFLQRPYNHENHGGDVERFDTRSSVVFLNGGLAYKLKRNVCYGDINYSTTELRQNACEKEITLNRRTAPELYLGVRSICRLPTGILAFDGPGVAIDYVVVMRRFENETRFHKMAESKRLTLAIIQELGRVIAKFHARSKVLPLEYGGEIMMSHLVSASIRDLWRYADWLDNVNVTRFSRYLHTALIHVAPVLDERRRAGKIRCCHGDLRLKNICLWNNKPAPFNAIEYGNESSCIDVLYDLSLPLMELYVRGDGDLARALLDAYLARSPEPGMEVVLPFFMALQAAFCACALASSADGDADEVQMQRRYSEARQYVSVGSGFLSSVGVPKLFTFTQPLKSTHIFHRDIRGRSQIHSEYRTDMHA